MNDLIVTINRDTRKVKTNRGFIGLHGENLQGNIIVDFTDKADFVDGTAVFEIVQNGEKYLIEMTKDATNKVYSLPIKSSLLKYACSLSCQVVIEQKPTGDGTPVFKSEVFQVPCLEAINATETITEQYIEDANAKLEEMDKAIARVTAISDDLEEKVANDYYKGDKGDLGGTYPLGETEATAYEGHKGKANAEHIKTLYEISEHSGQITSVETEQAYTTRTTADGTDIFDQYVKVKKIGGSTVVDPETNTLKNAYFKGIRATGRNLLPFTRRNDHEEINKVFFTINGDGTITASGTATADVSFQLGETKLTQGTYYLSGNLTSGSNVGIRLDLYVNGERVGGATDTGAGSVVTINEETQNANAVFTIFVKKGMGLNKHPFNPMLNVGDKPIEYEPYQTDERFMLSEAIELGKYDYIDVENKKIGRRTKTLVFNGNEGFDGSYIKQFGMVMFALQAKDYCTYGKTFVDNGNLKTGAGNGNGTNLSFTVDKSITLAEFKQNLQDRYEARNPLTVAYELKNYTEEDIEVPQYYNAYNKGTETVIQGDTDNSVYGAMPTITQRYYAKVGGMSDE